MLFGLQKWATYSEGGKESMMPYGVAIIFFILLATFARKIRKWILMSISAILLLASCNYVPSDQIGIRVENFGKDSSDYSLVYGKFPADWSRSSWNLLYPGQSMPIHIEATPIPSKDGVTFSCDPSILVSLIRNNESCRKYAFKFKAYQEALAFTGAIEQVILKECLEAMRGEIGEAASDSILFNRSAFETKIQDALKLKLSHAYGINLDQFSLIINPPAELEKAMNARLLAEQKTKTTLSSLANAEAEVKLAEVERRKMLTQTEGYTASYLKNKALDVYLKLAQSQNKVFILGDPEKLILQGN